MTKTAKTRNKKTLPKAAAEPKPAAPETPADMNLLRQLTIFDPEKFAAERIDVIGVGATGSYAVWFLAKIGMQNIHVWDDDTIESHNVPNQLYFMDQVGLKKVDALAENIKRATGVVIKTHSVRFEGQEPLGKHVFLLVDTMAGRKMIWDKSIKMKLNVSTLVETRISSDQGRVYILSPFNINHVRKWEATLCSDDEAEVSLCGTVPSIVTTASFIAAAAVWQFIKWLTARETAENEAIIGLRPMSVYVRNF